MSLPPRLTRGPHSGATVRMYIDSYVNEEAKLSLPAEVSLPRSWALRPLARKVFSSTAVARVLICFRLLSL